jgi:hypothetical protein
MASEKDHQSQGEHEKKDVGLHAGHVKTDEPRRDSNLESERQLESAIRAAERPQPREQAIDYATGRACFRSGEIRILDSTSSVEQTIYFSEADRKL